MSLSIDCLYEYWEGKAENELINSDEIFALEHLGDSTVLCGTGLGRLYAIDLNQTPDTSESLTRMLVQCCGPVYAIKSIKCYGSDLVIR